MMMRRAAIVSPLRTPVGTFEWQPLKGCRSRYWPATAVQAVVERVAGSIRCGLTMLSLRSPVRDSEVPCVGRWAALKAGLPVQVPGMQLDRRCGGSLQAVVTAAMMVQSGAADVVLAGGVESMSNIEYYSTDMRWGARSGSVRFHDRLSTGAGTFPACRALWQDLREWLRPRRILAA
ncbi:thiolase family protein [Cupriavidus basilensis]